MLSPVQVSPEADAEAGDRCQDTAAAAQPQHTGAACLYMWRPSAVAWSQPRSVKQASRLLAKPVLWNPSLLGRVEHATSETRSVSMAAGR